MIRKLKSIFSKISVKLPQNQEAAVAINSKNAKRKQDLIAIVVLSIIGIVLMVFLKYRATTSSKELAPEDKLPLKLEVASNALDIEKMWRNHFEDKLIEAKSKSDEKLKLIEDSINEQSVVYQNQLKAEIEKLKAQLQFIIEEQASSKRELSNVKLKSEAEDRQKDKPQVLDDSRITVNNLNRGEVFDRPKSARNFIPETGYVSGVLLGGIAVSTAMGSSSEPVPVVIRITDRGNLPKNFQIDLKNCQIMGSSYGDLSSERAIIRAETLSCRDKAKELIYTTKVAGIIYGDDGMNGIKGRVVQTSGKHLKNAIIGSMISGFAQSAKGQDQFSITSLGAVNTKKQGIGDMAKQGSLTGASNAAEKIADYYIKQAEAMSPVLFVSGGTKVDVVFTKGVHLSSIDVQEKLENLRNDKGSK